MPDRSGILSAIASGRKRNRALAYCLRMISAQTHFCVCRDGKPVSSFPDHALAYLAHCGWPGRSRRLSYATRGADLGQDRVKLIDHLQDVRTADIERGHEAQRVRPRRVQE